MCAWPQRNRFSPLSVRAQVKSSTTHAILREDSDFLDFSLGVGMLMAMRAESGMLCIIMTVTVAMVY